MPDDPKRTVQMNPLFESFSFECREYIPLVYNLEIIIICLYMYYIINPHAITLKRKCVESDPARDRRIPSLC